MLGAQGVGKTSLVRRYVDAMFSDRYLSTVGVKIDRKTVTFDERSLTLLIWDIHGEDGSLKVLPSYLKGAAGLLVVVDSSRPDETAEVARDLTARPETADLPFVLALNKADLVQDWAAVWAATADLRERAALTLETSAKEGTAVEDAFIGLARSSG